VKSLLKVVLGLVIGVVLAELAFSARDSGAFPHLNLYEADADLGVRLQPNTSMKLRVADNDVTTVQINSFGFRGGEWPAPTKGEVLVVGDSQVFGLGVEADQTFSAKLAEQLKVPVLNAGVPTYGPAEYTAVVERFVQRGPSSTVIYVLNLANDLFEVERPNLERHAVWDGWAVRRETAPKEVTNFPFRHQLMSRSHLVFALRKLMAGSGSVNEGFSTEGSWKDVVQASSGVTPLPPEDEGARQLLSQRAALNKELDVLADGLENYVSDKVYEDSNFAEAVKPLNPRGGDPRDILEVRQAEGARAVDLTALHLFMAAVGEGRNEAFLEALAKRRNDQALLKLLDDRRALRAKLEALKPEGEPTHVLPIEAVLARTRAACDRAGAKLVVVALPLDVMVSADEWKKYGVKPIDMTPTSVLVDDVVSRAERLGAIGVDPTAALLAAEPGAFLNGDLHLTPKGHAALAGAIVAAMNRPPKPKSTLLLPEARSWPPTEDEWRAAKECTVKGSTAAGCETKLVREWLRVSCLAQLKPGAGETDDGFAPELVDVKTGGHGDAATWRYYGQAGLIIPVVPGDAARVRFAWPSVERELQLDFPRDAPLTMAFTAPTRRVKSAGERNPQYGLSKVGDPLAPPTCPAGQVAAGALVRCAPSCDASTPCAKGHCEPWPAGSFCAVP
jgi:SGNH hydrolase-like domain, acetyltransferase AlgX